MAQLADEKRQLDRVRTLLAANAVAGKGFLTVACQIKDLSETGARLIVAESAVLPEQFELQIPKKNLSHVAILRWRRGPLVGVEFLPDRRIDERRESDSRITQLEAENADLRRRVADMAKRLFAYGDSDAQPI